MLSSARTFLRLLGADTPAWRRYLRLAVAHGLLCGLSMTALAPVLHHLLAGDTRAAAPWLAALLAGMALVWGVRRHVEQAGVRVGLAILRGARHHLGEHVARLPAGWFTPRATAQLAHTLTQDLMSVAQLPAHVFTPVITGVIAPVVLALALCVLHGPLGLLALAALPALAGALAFSAGLARQADEAFHHDFADASQRVVEFAQAQSVLRAFSGNADASRWLAHALARQRQSGARLIWRSAAAAVLNTWAVQAMLIALLAMALHWGLPGPGSEVASATAVALAVALLLIGRLAEAWLEVASYADALRSAHGQLHAIAALLDAQPLPEPAPAAAQAPRDASVTLRNVHFRYPGQEAGALHGVSLHVPAGSMTALIGASGAGKTTAARLIARFFDVDAGSVCIGGADVRHMASAQLAGQLSQVFQDSYLFSGSIADNLRMARPEASDAELMAAARQAGVDEIVARLPQGLDTPVDEGGARLSGGERQRIALARALLKNAPILLLDEATAALDAQNQALIGATLARLRGQRTLIVIAHQLSTVAMADQIVVLAEGRMVEQGTPAALAARHGHYAAFLAQRQAAQGWRLAAAPAGTPGARPAGGAH